MKAILNIILARACTAVEQEQPLNNTSIPNTIQVPRRDMKQHPVIQGELWYDNQ